MTLQIEDFNAIADARMAGEISEQDANDLEAALQFGQPLTPDLLAVVTKVREIQLRIHDDRRRTLLGAVLR